MQELIDKILFLIPNAKFSLREVGLPYYGEEIPVVLNGYNVDWSRTNNNPCPSQEQIDEVQL